MSEDSFIVNKLMALADKPRFHDYEDFRPAFSPRSMLRLGVFHGNYFNDDMSEVYEEDINKCNLFGVHCSLSRQEWIDRGWIDEVDPLGWFQWYLRFYNGRRIPHIDLRQISRQKKFVVRHGSAVRELGEGLLSKRRKQRQALLHWAAWPISDVRKE
jgi:hypothetical protein